jgi:indolepyruvate ferredoxin oxidoreductase, alpha subunit
MNGQDAVLLSVNDCGVKVLLFVPGYPITEVANALGAEITINEKVALEIALGASATGARSMVLVKQVGMNMLADPLVISATHTIGSGVVIIVGDDLGPKNSQVEMDSRYYGPLAELPVLDPKDPAALHDSILEAYALSERLRIPVIVRVTSRLLAAETSQILPRYSMGSCQGFERTTPELTMKGKHQKHHDKALPLAAEASESTPLNSLEISGQVGIIASGYPANLAEGLGASLLSVGYINPLPWKLILHFIEGHRLILVAEEPEPFIESQLRCSPNVKGRLSGHLPTGLLERSNIIRALESLDEKVELSIPFYERVSDRGYAQVCDKCPFIPLFYALAKVDAPVAGDAGCAIRAARDPFQSVDVVYGLGSSIGVASGFRKKGIAVIGDYALAHSGLQGLINAVWRKREVLVVLLKNDVAAMTGGQEVPDLTRLLETLAPTRYIDLPCSEEEIEKQLRQELSKTQVTLIVFKGKCSKYD